MRIISNNRIVTTVCTTQSGKVDAKTRENKGIKIMDIPESEDIVGLHRAIIAAIQIESQNKQR